MQINDNSKPIPRRQVKTLIHRFKILMSTNHSASGVSRQKKISRKTYYRHVNDYSAQGLPGLLNKPRKSNNHFQKEILLSEIRSIVRSNPKLGCRKISDRLKQAEIKRCYKTINNILKREGLRTENERVRYCDMQDRESEMYQ